MAQQFYNLLKLSPTLSHVYLQIKEASLECLPVISCCIAVISELNDVVHPISKHSVVVGVVLWRVTAQFVPTLKHLLQLHSVCVDICVLVYGGCRSNGYTDSIILLPGTT